MPIGVIFVNYAEVRAEQKITPMGVSGAGRGSRTLISCLGSIHNSRYTIPANYPINYITLILLMLKYTYAAELFL